MDVVTFSAFVTLTDDDWDHQEVWFKAEVLDGDENSLTVRPIAMRLTPTGRWSNLVPPPPRWRPALEVAARKCSWSRD